MEARVTIVHVCDVSLNLRRHSLKKMLKLYYMYVHIYWLFENDVWIILVEVSGCDLEPGCESSASG